MQLAVCTAYGIVSYNYMHSDAIWINFGSFLSHQVIWVNKCHMVATLGLYHTTAIIIINNNFMVWGTVINYKLNQWSVTTCVQSPKLFI